MTSGRRLEVFVATKGHAFARDAFEEMLRAVDVEPTFVDHPAAAMLMNPVSLRHFDALLLYDMPGMDFRAPIESRPEPIAPTAEFMAGFEALLEAGKGIVALHHAIAGWPGWPSYAETLGGAFLYRAGSIRGRDRPSSAYRGSLSYRVTVASPAHPVTSGVPQAFDLDDEPYLHEIFEDTIEPLLFRDTLLEIERFQTASDTVRRVPPNERNTSVGRTPTVVIGWAKAAGNSPLIYLQPGDGPQTFANPNYRILVGNALRWVASPEARAWVRARQ